MNSILKLIDSELLKAVHDCSKGGLAVAISELCMTNNIGCCLPLDKVPGEKIEFDRIMFSESHSRYVLVTKNKNLKKIKSILKKQKASFNVIGKFGDDTIKFTNKDEIVVDLNVNNAKKVWNQFFKRISTSYLMDIVCYFLRNVEQMLSNSMVRDKFHWMYYCHQGVRWHYN